MSTMSGGAGKGVLCMNVFLSMGGNLNHSSVLIKVIYPRWPGYTVYMLGCRLGVGTGGLLRKLRAAKQLLGQQFPVVIPLMSVAIPFCA